MDKFKLVSNYIASGDQPKAIEELTKDIQNNKKYNVLLGATGTGKTFSIAHIINNLQKNTLIMVHNKTLAGQLYSEFKQLFPENKVEYFISYFDFYQPEAYLPRSDTYIEKSSKANQEIEMLRLSTLNSLVNSDKVIVIASVAAIYGANDPNEFNKFKLTFTVNQKIKMRDFQDMIAKLNYSRSLDDLAPGTFRNKGDVIEISPSWTSDYIIRFSFFGDEIEEIATIEPLNRSLIERHKIIKIYPADEYVISNDKISESLKRIQDELDDRYKYFNSQNQLVEAQRIKQRTDYDLESLKEFGSCNGIENYSRHLELRDEGAAPFTLLDYFKDDWLLVMDESHISVPQIRGMYNTDRSRKTTLVNYGFRLPSAMDNRPLNFEEFENKFKNAIFVSATPSEWEIQKADNKVVEQIVRPTGLVDPIIEVRKSENQIDDLIKELKEQVKKNERTFIVTLTIRMSEDITQFLLNKGFKVAYLHNELKTLERSKVLNDLRRGRYDAVVGINLLREGLDIPEVSLVAILDADKDGFFRNTTSLIQIIGRAARNSNGKVFMYGDKMTKSMKAAIEETNRRRNIQIEYNKEHSITPTTIVKPIREDISLKDVEIDFNFKDRNKKDKKKTTLAKAQIIGRLKKQMQEAASNQEYERAAAIRDMIIDIEGE